VIVYPDGRGQTEDGVPVPRSMLERLACDAVINPVGLDGGHVLFDGRDKRTATDAQYQALVVRDQGCRYPDCHRPASWCDAHHVQWWDHGGGTDVDNLVLLCRFHHTRLHQRGHTAKLLPDGTFEVTGTDGNHPPIEAPRRPPAAKTLQPLNPDPGACDQPKLTRAHARASRARIAPYRAVGEPNRSRCTAMSVDLCAAGGAGLPDR